MIKDLLLKFVPAKVKVRGETVARGEGQLELAEKAFTIFEERLGWSNIHSRYLATAIAFGVQENLVAVLQEAQQHSESEDFEQEFVDRAEMDPSVIGATLEASKFVSTEELRDLLGRILAGDVQEPGSISTRAVSIAQDLSTDDLRRFLGLRAVSWRVLSHDGPKMIIMGKRVHIHGLSFLSVGTDKTEISAFNLAELQQLGLIKEQIPSSYLFLGGEIEELQLAYGDRIVSLRGTETSRQLNTGSYDLSRAGSEILGLFDDDEFPTLDGYFEDVCELWRRDGIDVKELNE